MMPVSGYMDSNPHMRNRVPYPQNYFPGFEAVPPHYKADAPKSPMYESWPCSSRYPVPYHGCCNHGNFPGYYSYRPPCPQFAPSPAFNGYPNYPSYPEPYPVYYAPPSHYLNEQPRYEYDKDPHTNYHCCGCPNHLQNQKYDRSSKMEERDNDAEKVEGDPVVPVQPRSSPYPIVWIPQEHGKHDDRIKASDSDEAPCLARPSKSLRPTEVIEEQPRVRNGWFPIDMNGLKSLMQGQGEKQSQNKQNQDLMTQFPFPIFWVPNSYRKQEEGENRDQRKMITASDHSEQAPVNVEPFNSDAKTDKPQLEKEISRDNNAVAGTKGASAKQKCVPIQVKEAKSEGTEDKGRDEAVKRAEDATKNAVGTTEKRKSPSPTKASKLPPVCLRVDPLPKKRNGNGSSRSPSPPKGQSEGTTTKASTALKEDSAMDTRDISGGLDNMEPGERKRKDIPVIEERSKENKAGEVNTQHCSGSLGNVEPGEKKRKDIPVIEERSEENKAGETTGASQAQVSVNSKDETKLKFEEVAVDEKEAASVKASNPIEPAQCKEVKRMSGDEAAKLIQSAFRGYEVRRWEPLKKLKQIADVREQVDDVKNRIQSLESSSYSDKDDKLRLLIGEKIMSLLLQLDTIQGFDSSVRNTRKSLVKELVILQERLDSLTSKWSEEKAKDFGKAESCGRTFENVSMEKESENALAALEDTNENANIKEPEQEYLAHIVDGKDYETTVAKTDKNTTEATSDIECHAAAPRIEGEDVLPTLEHSMSSVPEQKLNADGIMEANDQMSLDKFNNVDTNENANIKEPEQECLAHIVDGKDDETTVAKAKTDKNTMEVTSDTECHAAAPRIEGEDVLPTLEHMSHMSSVPEQKLNADDIMGANDQMSLDKFNNVDVDCESVIEIENNNGEKETDLPINPSLPDDENLRCTDEVQVIDLLKELPVGVIDEEPAISQVDEHLPEAELNKCVKGEKENEFTDNPELVDNDNQSEPFFKLEEVHSTAGEEHNDELQQHEDDLGATPPDLTITSETEAGSDATEEKQVLFEEKKGTEQSVGTGTEEKDGVLSESHAEEDMEHELAKIGEDNKLIEENMRLKEMMEKLMEVGKDQLTVISNLTERVKDLEQKLAGTRKSSKPGKRKLRYAKSCYKPVKAKNRVAQVAMKNTTHMEVVNMYRIQTRIGSLRIPRFWSTRSSRALIIERGSFTTY